VLSAQPYVPTSYLELNAKSKPAAPALIDGDRVMSFEELRERVHASAAALRDRGARAGEVVAVSLPSVWE